MWLAPEPDVIADLRNQLAAANATIAALREGLEDTVTRITDAAKLIDEGNIEGARETKEESK